MRHPFLFPVCFMRNLFCSSVNSVFLIKECEFEKSNWYGMIWSSSFKVNVDILSCFRKAANDFSCSWLNFLIVIFTLNFPNSLLPVDGCFVSSSV